MGRVQARAVASTNREEAPAAHGRPRLSRIVLATAAGLGLLAVRQPDMQARLPSELGPGMPGSPVLTTIRVGMAAPYVSSH
jgi:hypothetical protein